MTEKIEGMDPWLSITVAELALVSSLRKAGELEWARSLICGELSASEGLPPWDSVGTGLMLRGHLGVVDGAIVLSEDLAFVAFVLGTTQELLEVQAQLPSGGMERWLLAENSESGRSLLLNLSVAPAGIGVSPLNSTADEFVRSLLSSETSTVLHFHRRVRGGAIHSFEVRTTEGLALPEYEGAEVEVVEMAELVLAAEG